MPNCFVPANILLPDENIPLSQWACLACDQFTSQPEYWQKAEALTEGKPSALHLVLPEVYLGKPGEAERIAAIQANMKEYRGTVLNRAVKGFVYVERDTGCGPVRPGLLGAVDLEQYSYTPGSSPAVRPTENTVVERIPPRLAVRRGASLELPHVMMLINDRDDHILGGLAAKKDRLRPLYSGELMLGGGSIRGWAVEDEALCGALSDAIEALGSQEAFDQEFPAAAGQPPITLAVGDGNHSLATAKAYWEELKSTLPPEQRETHPARWCLAEVCNLYSDSIQIESIPRVLFDVSADEVLRQLHAYGEERHLGLHLGLRLRCLGRRQCICKLCINLIFCLFLCFFHLRLGLSLFCFNLFFHICTHLVFDSLCHVTAGVKSCRQKHRLSEDIGELLHLFIIFFYRRF